MRPPRGVPRDEWLLAIGLANQGASRHANYGKHGFIHWVAAWIKDAPLVCDEVWGAWKRDDDSDELAAMWGADSVRRTWESTTAIDGGWRNPDAYAAGAALAMALEAE